MAEIKGENISFSGEGICSVPISPVVSNHTLLNEYAGVILNQNSDPSGKIPMNNEEYIWQTFRLPTDYPLGSASIIIPQLCGFQINVEISDFQTAGLSWAIEYWDSKRGWIGVAKGIEVGASQNGNVWFTVKFNPVSIDNFWFQKFRLGIAGRKARQREIHNPVTINPKTNEVTIENENILVIPNISPAPLSNGNRYIFEHNGAHVMIELKDREPYFFSQFGIEGVYFTSPNPFLGSNSIEEITVPTTALGEVNREFEEVIAGIPFATSTEKPNFITIPRTTSSDIKAYGPDGVSPILYEGKEISLRFRILSMRPDAGRDCTESVYRTVAVPSKPESVITSVGELEGAYWISAPNPSQFACEALYADIREGPNPSVVDHIVVDPVTPGVYMNVYYSNDPAPGSSTQTWDSLLWNRIDKQFLLRRKESFALPEPISANFIKLEFTRLQPIWYSPGTFQFPTIYRKHPKWVMDFYLSLYESVRSRELESASTVNVTYSALELAYQYYLDDIRQDSPNPPTTVNSTEGVSLLSKVLSQEQEKEINEVDPQTLAQINLSMQKFTSQPAQQGSFDSLLQKIISPTVEINNYPVESIVNPTSETNQVSSIERDSLIIEKQFPVTSFYLPCRHYYAFAEAKFEEGRAYLAGLKEVAFIREHYETKFDTPLYIESAGDNFNTEINDLISQDHSWVTYES